MKIAGSSISAVLHKILFNDSPHMESLSNANKLPSDVSISQALAVAGGFPLRYHALITQSSTTAPVATVKLNQLGGTVVWARTSAGVYTATLVGAFAGTVLERDYGLMPAGAAGGRVKIIQTSDDVITVSTFNASNAAADALLTAHYLEIEVIPTV